MERLLHLGISVTPDFFVSYIDMIALMLFAFAWYGYESFANKLGNTNNNLLSLVHNFRQRWMQRMLQRDNRVMDITAVGNLLRSISFFANTSIFLAFGAVTMMGYREKAQEIVNIIPFAYHSSEAMWEFKVLLLVLIFIHAFFKFTWSLRQYNYINIYVAGAPLCNEELENHDAYAQCGAMLMTNAARHFNLGLRAYYYGFAGITWFIHPLAFIGATCLVIWVLYRREFHSNMYYILSDHRQ